MIYKRALVTGANGFVGRYLVNYLVENDYIVYALVRESADIEVLEGIDCNIVKGNILDQYLLKELIIKVDVIFHLAGMGLNRIKSEKMKDFNEVSTKIICEMLAKTKKDMSLVYLSSAKIYEASDKYVKKKETDSYGLTDCYGTSKANAEKLAVDVCKNLTNIKLLIIRAPFIIGNSDKNTAVLYKMKNSRIKFKMAGNLSFSSYIGVGELCSLLEKIYRIQVKKIEIINVGCRDTININRLIDVINKHGKKTYIELRIPGKLLYIMALIIEKLGIRKFIQPERVMDMTKYNWILNTNYLEETYGIQCKCSIEECLE